MGQYKTCLEDNKIALSILEGISTKLQLMGTCCILEQECPFLTRNEACLFCGRKPVIPDVTAPPMPADYPGHPLSRLPRPKPPATKNPVWKRKWSAEAHFKKRKQWEEWTYPDGSCGWQPNNDNKCVVCKESFGFFQGKHHCRFCGKLAHDKHSKGRLPGFQGSDQEHRACDTCFKLATA